MEQQSEQERRRECLRQQALRGDRAQAVLEYLEEFRGKREQQILARLAGAKTPDEAFLEAAKHQALVSLVNDAKGAVNIGRQAAREIMEEE